MPDHLSYSSVSKWEQCKYAWKCNYIYQMPKSENVHLGLGKAAHEVLEEVYQSHVKNESTGKLDTELGLGLWKRAWNRYVKTLGDAQLFNRGWQMVHRAMLEEGHVDHWDVIGIEQPFEFMAGPFKVIGFIDRVDRHGPDLEVIDYKTNWHLFAPWEVDDSLQMTIYDIAVRNIWPWARDVQLTFHMLKHGVKLYTKRTQEQRDSAMSYLETIGYAIDEEKDFEPSVNMYCSMCNHRNACPEWRRLILEKEQLDSKENLEDIAEEREWLVIKEKAITSRRKLMDRKLMEAIRDTDQLKLNGKTYQVYEVPNLSYPVIEAARLISEKMNCNMTEAVEKICAVDNKKLEKVLDGISGEKERMLIKMELETIARKKYYPRLWSK